MKKGLNMTALSNLSATVPFTQLQFVFPEPDPQSKSLQPVRSEETIYSQNVVSKNDSYDPRLVPIGIAVPPAQKTTLKKKRMPTVASVANASRRNKPEHISDLLLVVLDRYGIDASEFMAGLE